MNVLVDTSIWSLALRRLIKNLNPDEFHLVQEWNQLIKNGQAYLMGPIRQELLSGIRHPTQFQQVREHLRAFRDLTLLTSDYEQAAMFFNDCRKKGVTGTPIDLLICAIAYRLKLAIFTTDTDFPRYAKILPIH